mmetsp:Transcript_15070/g.22198  ORF Transcript_15070/g.22198 Transcript_15070/m.22198 type:complete len:1003 (-) Transcript_15070:283-3291(-)|eukprot:CAMPEP_0195516550 /NCGR_PEP_ID=MMETSP0794_2-20130614/7626_1 /TAXON_ID=515487 /ORGANISM="Stephanopyxis turris, Strain CCMP 815" /LENGTH=1002 /DNA_ID=CAMNT_0040645171 /DNA_START=86 /DNA_END=3094 /DNA_ORIENTATION=+
MNPTNLTPSVKTEEEDIIEARSPPSNDAILKLQLGEHAMRRISISRLLHSNGKLSYEKLLNWAVRYSPSFERSDENMLDNHKMLFSHYQVETTYIDDEGDRVWFSTDEEFLDAFHQAPRVPGEGSINIDGAGNALSTKNRSSNPSSCCATSVSSSSSDDSGSKSGDEKSPVTFKPRTKVVLKVNANVWKLNPVSASDRLSEVASSSPEMGTYGYIPTGLRTTCQPSQSTNPQSSARRWSCANSHKKQYRKSQRQIQNLLESFVTILASAVMALQGHLAGISANARRIDEIATGKLSTCNVSRSEEEEVVFTPAETLKEESEDDKAAREVAERLMKEVISNLEQKEADVPEPVPECGPPSAEEVTSSEDENYIPKNNDTAELNPEFIHGRHTCDGCMMNPIVGIRYHATNLRDYDLCQSCKNAYTGSDITFEPEECERDNRFQHRYARKVHRSQRSCRRSQRSPYPGRLRGNRRPMKQSDEDAAIKEAIRRSLMDTKKEPVDVAKQPSVVMEESPRQDVAPASALNDEANKNENNYEGVVKALGFTLDQCALVVGTIVNEFVDKNSKKSSCNASADSKKHAVEAASMVTEKPVAVETATQDSVSHLTESESIEEGLPNKEIDNEKVEEIRNDHEEKGVATNEEEIAVDEEEGEPDGVNGIPNAVLDCKQKWLVNNGLDAAAAEDQQGGNLIAVDNEEEGNAIIDTEESCLVSYSADAAAQDQQENGGLNVEKEGIVLEEEEEDLTEINGIPTVVLDCKDMRLVNNDLDAAEDKQEDHSLAFKNEKQPLIVKEVSSLDDESSVTSISITNSSDATEKPQSERGGITILESIQTDEQSVVLSADVSDDEWSVVKSDISNSSNVEEYMLARATSVIGSALFQEDISRSADALSDSVMITNTSEVISLADDNSSLSGSVSSASLISTPSVESYPSVVSSVPTISSEVPAAVMARWGDEIQKLRELGFADDVKSADAFETLEAANMGVDSTEPVTISDAVNYLLNKAD